MLWKLFLLAIHGFMDVNILCSPLDFPGSNKPKLYSLFLWDQLFSFHLSISSCNILFFSYNIFYLIKIRPIPSMLLKISELYSFYEWIISHCGNSLNFFLIFFRILILLYVHELFFACIVCAPCACIVPIEIRRGCQISWD